MCSTRSDWRRNRGNKKPPHLRGWLGAAGLRGSRSGSGNEVEEFAVGQLVGRHAIALVGRVGVLAHNKAGVVLAVADGSVGILLVVSVVLAANEF